MVRPHAKRPLCPDPSVTLQILRLRRTRFEDEVGIAVECSLIELQLALRPDRISAGKRPSQLGCRTKRRLKTLRETKNLSQGDIETNRFAPLLCFSGREWSHRPIGETLEKFAAALKMPLFHLMFDGDKPPALPKSAKPSTEDSLESSRPGSLLMRKLPPLLAKMNQDDRNLILFMAGRVSKKQAGMKAGRKLASSLAA